MPMSLKKVNQSLTMKADENAVLVYLLVSLWVNVSANHLTPWLLCGVRTRFGLLKSGQRKLSRWNLSLSFIVTCGRNFILLVLPHEGPRSKSAKPTFNRRDSFAEQVIQRPSQEYQPRKIQYDSVYSDIIQYNPIQYNPL